MSLTLPEPGLVIDRYAVEAEIGAGGMGRVYRVRHVALDSVHALKVLTVGGAALRLRLMREGRAQAQLRHPNVVPVTDIVDVDGAPGLVMDYIPGDSMADWLTTARPSLEEAERIFRGIVAGVATAHRAGIVHRDLKPSNVLLHHVDGELVPKVADFGLATALAEDGNPAITRSGVVMGTAAYMAPEQLRDAARVDRRADIFSLGCILYELVTGRRAFPAEHMVEVFVHVAEGKFRRPGEWVPGLPDRVCATIEACLSPDRERRPADCAALLAMLSGSGAPVNHEPATTQTWGGDAEGTPPVDAPARPALAGVSATPGPGAAVDTLPPSSSSPTAAWARRRRLGNTALVATLLVGASVAGWASWRRGDGGGSPAAPPVGEPPPPVPAGAEGLAVVEEAASPPAAAVGAHPEPVATPPPSTAATTTKPTTTTTPTTRARPPAEVVTPPAPEALPPPAATTGSFAATGAKSVFLDGGGRRWWPGEPVPPGTYTVMAQFSDPLHVPATKVVIVAGATVELVCSATFTTCRVE